MIHKVPSVLRARNRGIGIDYPFTVHQQFKKQRQKKDNKHKIIQVTFDRKLWANPFKIQSNIEQRMKRFSSRKENIMGKLLWIILGGS